MDEQQARMPVSTDEIIDVSKEEKMDDFMESPEDYKEAEAEEEEVIEWMELERANTQGKIESSSAPLLRREDIDELQSRWNSIQTAFVDEPHSSVEQADVLVAEVMERIVGMFSEKRSLLDEQWADQEDVSTEDLRVALQRYRSFFNRLLTL